MIGDRIKQLIDEYELSYSEFAQQLGVQASSISHIVSGRNKPSIDFIQKLHQHYPEVQTNWLLFGQGFPFASTKEKEEAVSPTLFDENYNKENKDENMKIEPSHSPENPKTEIVNDDNESIEIGNSEEYSSLTLKENPTVDSQRLEKNVKSILIIYTDGSYEEFQLKR